MSATAVKACHVCGSTERVYAGVCDDCADKGSPGSYTQKFVDGMPSPIYLYDNEASCLLCSQRIVPGEPATYQNGSYVHKNCAARASRE